jgi:hypothetical protein
VLIVFRTFFFKGAESGYFARFTKSIKPSTGATLQREPDWFDHHAVECIRGPVMQVATGLPLISCALSPVSDLG